MAENLTVDDVVEFTGGRLTDTDETQRMLDAALGLVRQRCGWHVSPVLQDAEMTVDGPGGRELLLRTRKIVKVTEVVNDGVTLNAADVVVPVEAPWKLLLKTGVWSSEYAGVVATIDHGYTAAEAASWRQAVLTVVDRLSQTSQTGRADTELIRKQVDDVSYQWTDPSATVEVLLSVDHVLANYDLKWLFV
jgi:hypothetical protein